MRDPNCSRCSLAATCRYVCTEAEGSSRASLLVLDEQVKSDEEDTGRPASGRAGKLLRAALENLGVEYRIANVVRCRPPDNRKPTAEEMKACRVYLDQDIREMPNLKLVVLLGTIPKTAFGVKGQIMELAGTPIFGHEDLSLPTLLPIAHPSYVLRNQNYLPTWQAHWDVAKGLLRSGLDPVEIIGARILDRVEEP